MAVMALLPPMLQRLFGYPVLDTGLLLMPRGIGVVFSMAVAGQWIQRGKDPRVPIGLGLAIVAWSLYEMTGWTLMMGSRDSSLPASCRGSAWGWCSCRSTRSPSPPWRRSTVPRDRA